MMSELFEAWGDADSTITHIRYVLNWDLSDEEKVRQITEYVKEYDEKVESKR